MFTHEFGTEFQQGGSRILEYLIPGDEPRYPLRHAEESDLEALVALRQACSEWIANKEGANGMWKEDWPNKELALSERLRNIQAGNTFVVENDEGEVCASVTIKDEGNQMLWGDLASEPALYISSLMKHPSVKDAKIGKELLWWACSQAVQQGKVWVRLDVWDENTGLKAYYRDCEFQQLPSKVWATYPASARFQLSPFEFEQYPRSFNSKACTPHELLQADHPFSVVPDLTPFSIAEWRWHTKSYQNLFLGSTVNGQLSLPSEQFPDYRECRDSLGIEPEFLRKLTRHDPDFVLSLLSEWQLHSPADDGFKITPNGPINIYDMLDQSTQTALIGTLGLARFLASVNLGQREDVAWQRGLRHVFDQNGRKYGWLVHFTDIERPAETKAALERAMRYFKGANYAPPGILVEGDLVGGNLELQDTELPLCLPPSLMSSCVEIDPHSIVPDRWLRPPVGDEFGPQPYEPQQGDRFMARVSLPPTDPGNVARMHATLFKVTR